MSVETIKKHILKEIEGLSESELEVLERLVQSYALSVKNRATYDIEPDVLRMKGLLPSSQRLRDEYYEYLGHKHA